MTTTPVPTLYDWLGGIDALNRLTTRFYEHVAQDELLAPVFAHMGADHPAHVAAGRFRLEAQIEQRLNFIQREADRLRPFDKPDALDGALRE